jgi:hypothetical protein
VTVEKQPPGIAIRKNRRRQVNLFPNNSLHAQAHAFSSVH